MVDKSAETDVPLHEPIRARWSPRAFAAQRVEWVTLQTLFEAARWAPSSNNEQPWSFRVATRDDRAEFERLLSCLKPGNIRWAQHASVLLLSVTQLAFDSGEPNRHAFHDVGLGVENLVIQATAMGLIAHQIAGFSPEKATELYGIPDGFEPVAAIAVGYLGNPETLPDDLRARELRPRRRKPVSDFVFTGRWGARPVALASDTRQ